MVFVYIAIAVGGGIAMSYVGPYLSRNYSHLAILFGLMVAFGFLILAVAKRIVARPGWYRASVWLLWTGTVIMGAGLVGVVLTTMKPR